MFSEKTCIPRYMIMLWKSPVENNLFNGNQCEKYKQMKELYAKTRSYI